MLAPFLTLLLLGASTPQQDTTGRLSNVAVHRQPSLPVVAIRLSVQADDPQGYAGAGHLLQHLAFPALQSRVEQVGGRAEIARTADAMVFSVTGPADELSHLAEALRAALRPPEPSPFAFATAHRDLAAERDSEQETAAARVRALLRRRLFADDLPVAGTDASARRLLEVETVRRAWAEMYRPDRVFVVAVGDVQPSTVEQAFGNLPAAARSDALAVEDDSVPAPMEAGAEASRPWVGVGYDASDLPPAAVAATARIMADRLRRTLPDAETSVEHWWTRRGQAIVAIAATPERSLPRARRALDSLAVSLSEENAVEGARASSVRIRRDMLFHGRTPVRMAELLGAFVDRSRDRDPAATQRFWAQLDQVDDSAVARVLGELAGREPTRVLIPAQRLRPSSPAPTPPRAAPRTSTPRPVRRSR